MLSSPKPTICLLNLGCAKNLVDSEVILGKLSVSGYIPYPDPEKADIILINTCGFIEAARRESRRAIRRVLKFKQQDPAKVVGVIGCFVAKEREKLVRSFPEIDLWLGVKELGQIVEAIEGKKLRAQRHTFLYGDKMPRLLSTPKVWAYIKIAEGCSHACSFCTIPQIKGPYRSRRMASVIREAEKLVESGVKEVILISQDTTYFGRDRKQRSELPRLLEKLIKIPKLAWVRWLYGFPEEVDDRLLEVMQDSKICPYFDLPFQHSHPRVLKLMRRGFDGSRALKLVEKIRCRIPDAALRSTLIVGFPGEGKKEFLDLTRFVREAQFDHLGVFTYSAEPGTEAYSLGDPVPTAEKEQRRLEIMELQAEISRQRLRCFRGQRLEVLFDGTTDSNQKFYLGRTKYQAPEVDGQVKLLHAGEKLFPCPGIYRVEIIRTSQYDLQGRFLG